MCITTQGSSIDASASKNASVSKNASASKNAVNDDILKKKKEETCQ